MKPTYPNTVFQYSGWKVDPPGWHYSPAKYLYGKFCFEARLSGNIYPDIRPSLWLVDYGQTTHYFEIDIELFWDVNRESPYLLFTSWNSHIDSDPNIAEVERIRLNNQYLIKKLRLESNEFVIDWQKDRIEFRINGLLAGVIKNVPKGAMNIAFGNVSIEKIVKYN